MLAGTGLHADAETVAASDSWNTPYAQTVDMHIGWSDLKSGGAALPAGQTQMANDATTYIQKALNINFIYDFITPGANNAYDTKVSLVLASGSIPDVMQANLGQFHRMANAGLLEDLTAVTKQYWSPYLKSLFAAAPRSLAAATVGGKLLAIPDTPVDLQYQLLWVRQDWLDKVHLAPPKSVDDIVGVAQAFIGAKLGGANTVGLTGNSGGTTLSTYNGVSGWDSILSSFGAFEVSGSGNPAYFRKNGQIVYGPVQPEMKTALAKLAAMYKAGVIDPQFASRSNTDMVALLTSGKAGMFFGPWWMPYYPLNSSVINNPTADWRCYLVPIGASGKLEAMGVGAATTFFVVRKGYAHPEAPMKIMSLDQNVLRFRPPASDPLALKVYNDISIKGTMNWTYLPLCEQWDYVDEVYRQYKDVVVPYDNNDRGAAGAYDGQRPRLLAMYDSLAAWTKKTDPVKNNIGWATYNAIDKGIGLEGRAVDNHLVHVNYMLDYYSTPTMLSRQAALASLQQRTMFGIVTGQMPLSQFDSFVNQWHALGGNAILKELKQQLG
jgi:putative aldouronate transport system substrate-binding protein